MHHALVRVSWDSMNIASFTQTGVNDGDTVAYID